ncbi:DUF6265 family protein [Microbulbifer sp. GL-2]|uniref:DUF6265 family protein n=1 Tax=Microbulbifer sp. GL-2 TaxID=2591606 RepID=UPI00117CD8D1|nr:DUF6265 family protein [Microbulbifer sp. GL-2]
MKKTVWLSLIIVAFHSQVFASGSCSLSDLGWLEGNWYFETDKLKVIEHWERISPKTLEGNGLTKSTRSGDIISSETLRLVEMSGEIFYVAKVKSNDFPVPFKLVQCSSRHAGFENVNHDFPKKLIYQLVDANHIDVFVSGEKEKEFTMKYTRMNDI